MKLNLSESYIKRIKELSNIQEVKVQDEIYFETLSGALDYAVKKAEAKGYQVDENEQFQFGIGGISYGQTKSYNFSLTKDELPTRRVLVVSMYRMPSGRYELTSYVG